MRFAARRNVVNVSRIICTRSPSRWERALGLGEALVNRKGGGGRFPMRVPVWVDVVGVSFGVEIDAPEGRQRLFDFSFSGDIAGKGGGGNTAPPHRSHRCGGNHAP